MGPWLLPGCGGDGAEDLLSGDGADSSGCGVSVGVGESFTGGVDASASLPSTRPPSAAAVGVVAAATAAVLGPLLDDGVVSADVAAAFDATAAVVAASADSVAVVATREAENSRSVAAVALEVSDIPGGGVAGDAVAAVSMSANCGAGPDTADAVSWSGCTFRLKLDQAGEGGHSQTWRALEAKRGAREGLRPLSSLYRANTSEFG